MWLENQRQRHQDHRRITVTDERGRPVRDNEGNRIYRYERMRAPVVRQYTVFNAEQADGLPAPASAHGRAALEGAPAGREGAGVRQRMHGVLEWAVAMELRTDNPCDRIGRVLGPQNDVVHHFRALPHGMVASAIQTVRATDAPRVLKLAFEFLVLTATRWNEVRGAAWEEIDPREGVWAVPATRMKAKREHRVPLCGRAIDIIDEARTFGDGSPIVFTIGDGQPIIEQHLRRLLATLEIAAVPHGFRSSFRDWAAEETDHPREVVEAALAHVVRNKVEAAYRRSDLFERRHVLMDDWAAYLAGERRDPEAQRVG